VALVRERTIPTGRQPLVGEVSAVRRYSVVSAMDPQGRNLGFLDRVPLATEHNDSSLNKKRPHSILHTASSAHFTQKANKLTISLRWIVSFKPMPLYHWCKSPRYPLNRSWVYPTTGLSDMEKRKFLTLPGLELRSLGRPARRQSLY
jgi:hypothetical protein